MSAHSGDHFVARREGIQDRVAEILVDRGERLAKRFDDEPYNSDKLSSEQKRAAFAAVREDALYLGERHTHYAKINKLPEGQLDKGYLEDLARHEAEFQEHKSDKQRPIDVTFPQLDEGPLGPGGG